MRRYPIIPDVLNCTVEEWTADGQHIAETLAKCSNPLIARAAFKAAVDLRPHARILVRQGARVLADSEDRLRPLSEARR
jgi:hypothetical protein